jgi:hypothetical protein
MAGPAAPASSGANSPDSISRPATSRGQTNHRRDCRPVAQFLLVLLARVATPVQLLARMLVAALVPVLVAAVTICSPP